MTVFWARVASFFFLLVGLQSSSCLSLGSQTSLADKEKSLLWKISGNGLSAPSYLFGTIHFICKDDYLWTTEMQHALDECSHIALELDMDEPGLPSELAQAMMLKEGEQLSDFFSKEQYEQLSTDLATNASISIKTLERFKPFAVVSLLSMRSLTCPNPQSYEAELVAQAQVSGKEILGLEQASDQIEVLERINTDSMAAAIIKYAGQPAELRQQYQQLLTAYKNQDIQTLHQLILQAPEYNFNMEDLLYARNRKWVPKITDQSKKGATFFAVGAGHLAGPEGLINLLRKSGFTLTAIK